MISLPRTAAAQPAAGLVIKVAGLGGAGCNVLDRMQLDGIEGAGLLALNTDAQALAGSVAPIKIQIGRETTRGLGTGGDPEPGYAAAEESEQEIRGAIDGASLVFLCAGLGGGTGSGAAPLVANHARQQGAVVCAVVTMPFTFEGRRRMVQAEDALASLLQQADIVLCFENDRMGESVSPRATIQEAFAAADHTISQSVRAIVAMLSREGLIRVGFDELTAALRAQNPRCLFGYGEAEGDNRAHAALERALRNPLMDRGRLLSDAQNVLVHVAGGPSMTLNEVTLLMEQLNRYISDSTRILFSTAVEQKLGSRLCVTILSSIGTPLNGHAALPQAAPRHETPGIQAPRLEEMPFPGPQPDLIAPLCEPARAEAPVEPAAERQSAASIEAAPRPAAAKPARGASRARPPREERQEQMTFEPVNRGRFEKSEPTIVDGQDLDVPAFMRMNVRIK
jgi:cell division protein FtsZ